MIAVGVDPGNRTGAIAFWDGSVLKVFDLPNAKRVVAGRNQSEIDSYALGRLVREHVKNPADACCLIEKVGPMPHDSKIAAAAFVGASREIRGVIRCLEIPCAEITVPSWRKAVGVPKAVAGDKGPCVARATELFPEHAHLWTRKKDVNRCEAVLIALAAWQQRMELCGKS